MKTLNHNLGWKMQSGTDLRGTSDPNSKLEQDCFVTLAVKFRENHPLPLQWTYKKKRKEGTVVLRMVMDRKYCTNWNHIVKKPCEAARAWCVRQHAAAHATILDAWNFQLSDDTVVKGLIRVKSPEIAQALFQQSGFEHQGARWFVEILQPDSSPQVVQWYPWDGEEDWNAYGTRCRQAAGQNGLVTGRQQLGIKIPANQASAVPTKWVIEHLPADAHMDDLQEFLTRHAFGEVEILEKARRKNGTTWTFKGLVKIEKNCSKA